MSKFTVRLHGFLTILVMAFPAYLSAQETQIVARPLKDITVVTYSRTPARVTASNESVLAAEIDGVIATVNVDITDRVKKGDLLVQLDRRDANLQVAQAEANLKAQQARVKRGEVRLTRAQKLAEESFVSEDELLERETDLDVLVADREVQDVSVRTAKRELQKTRILAPYNGVVVQRDAQVGAFASRGTALLTLAQTGSSRVLAEVSPVELESITGSSELDFRNEVGSWPVEVNSVSPIVNARSRVQTLRLTFNTDEKPPVGSSGYLVWQRPEKVVATDVVVRRSGQLGVFVYQDNTAKFFAIETAEEGQPTIVPLPDDTLVIIEGQQRVQDGDKVVNSS